TFYQRSRAIATRYESAKVNARLGTYDSYNKAREDYVAIIKLDSKDDKAATELAAIHALTMIDYGEDAHSLVQTMNRRGEEQLQRHHVKSNPAGITVAQAALLLRKGELDKAKELIVKADASNPEEPRLPYLLALVRSAAGDDKDAVAKLNQSLSRDANFV